MRSTFKLRVMMTMSLILLPVIFQISRFPCDNFSDHVLHVWELNDCDKDERGGGKWCLEEQLWFNQIVTEKSPSLSKYVLTKNPYLLVLAYHLNDRDVVYLMIDFKVVLCNLRRETLEVVRDFPDHQPSYNVFNFVLPYWPTPIHSSPFLLVKAAYLFCCLLAWVFKAF